MGSWCLVYVNSVVYGAALIVVFALFYLLDSFIVCKVVVALVVWFEFSVL